MVNSFLGTMVAHRLVAQIKKNLEKGKQNEYVRTKRNESERNES